MANRAQIFSSYSLQGAIELQLLCSLWVEEGKTVPFWEGVRQFALVLDFIFLFKNRKKKKLKENNTCSFWHVNVGFEGLHLFFLKMCQHMFG